MPSHINQAKGLSGVGADAEVSEFLSGGGFAKGEWVKLDTSKANESRVAYVIQGIADGLTVGVALDAASGAEEIIRVVTHGYVEGARTDGTAAIGDTLVAAAAGEATVMAAGSTDRAIGVALETDAGSAAAENCDTYVFGLR
jgi:hypothetical protein